MRPFYTYPLRTIYAVVAGTAVKKCVDTTINVVHLTWPVNYIDDNSFTQRQ